MKDTSNKVNRQARRRRIYVASSWRNEQQQAVVAQLRDAGHEVYDFKNPEGRTGFSWKQVLDTPPPWSAVETRKVLRHPVSEAGFRSDFDAMIWADTIVMLQPCGRSAALEVGWGAGAGKLTIALLADGQEPELMLKCCDHVAVSIEEVLTLLARPVPQLRSVRRTVAREDVTALAILTDARSISPHERKKLVVTMLEELRLELFGDPSVAVKLAHQVLTDSLTDDTFDWLKARAEARGLK